MRSSKAPRGPSQPAWSTIGWGAINECRIKRCQSAFPHSWADCPFVHEHETAARRDPRLYPYSSTMCLDTKAVRRDPIV